MENSDLIQKALRYIRSATPESPLTLDDVARHAGFSTDYFNRIFASHTGFTVMEYVRFTRLRRASLDLRTSDDSVLDIALRWGYDSHESFTRAFKKQYGLTPLEFRETMRGIEPLYGDYHNETVGARLLHAFPAMRRADDNDIIDILLARDAIRWGYFAVCCHINGGAALYDGERPEDGFVWFTEWDDFFSAEIFAEDYDTIAQYCRLLSDEKFRVSIFTPDVPETILGELAARGVRYTSVSVHNEAIYRGNPYTLTPPDGITMRALSHEDFPQIEAYYREKYGEIEPMRARFLENLQKELRGRDVFGGENWSVFVFGLFNGMHMIGISLGALQSVHGFTLNNGIYTSLLDGYSRPALERYAFQFVTNAALAVGALPFDDVQCNPEEEPDWLDSRDVGYEVVQRRCELIR